MKGTKTYFNSELLAYELIRERFIQTAQSFGCKLVHISAMEQGDTFVRTAGATSDLCNKELFIVQNLKSQKEQQLQSATVLKPEGTAPVIKALNEEQVIFNSSVRVSYFDRMYRYNRPQKYRLRELTQAGVEFFGSGALVDFEAISCAHSTLCAILKALSAEKNITSTAQESTLSIDPVKACSITLRINHIGDIGIRARYSAQLGEYFANNRNKISEATYYKSLENPLRALDKLTEHEKQSLTDMPKILDLISDPQFDHLQKLLQEAGISFEIDPFIIRGLDYYAKTVFEFTTHDTTLLAGGRYDHLVSMLTKQDCAGIGWSLGVDRIIDYLMPILKQASPLYIINMDQDILTAKTAAQMRQRGFNVICLTVHDIGKGLKQADRSNATHVMIIGPDESANSYATVKDMASGESIKARTIDDVIDFISR